MCDKKFEFEKNNEYVDNALSKLDFTKQMVTYLKEERYIEFLKYYSIDTVDYKILHSAYFSSNDINASYLALPYTLLQKLFEEINIKFFGMDGASVYYQEIEIAKIQVQQRKYVVVNYSLKTISDEIRRIKSYIREINDKVNSRKNDGEVVNTIALLSDKINKIKLPVDEVNEKIKEMKSIFDAIGYEEVEQLEK